MGGEKSEAIAARCLGECCELLQRVQIRKCMHAIQAVASVYMASFTNLRSQSGWSTDIVEIRSKEWRVRSLPVLAVLEAHIRWLFLLTARIFIR